MAIHIPYTPTPVDERFYHAFSKGLKREKTTEIACNIFKQIARVFAIGIGITGAVSLLILPGIIVPLLGVTSAIVILAFPIIICVTGLLAGSTIALYAAFKGRAQLASNRIRVEDRAHVNKIRAFRMVLQNPRFARAHMLIPSNSDAVFYQRIGIISSDTRKQIKEINSLYFPTKRYRRFNQGRRMQRIEARWDEMRVRMQNDLPSDLMLGELLK